MFHRCCVLLFCLTAVANSRLGCAEEFHACAWNVESGGITRSKIGAQLRAFENVSLWALSEVQASNADFFIASAGEGEAGEFSGVIGTTGGADRLVIAFDESKFELVDSFEFDDLALGGRAPLVARLRTRSDATEFFFVAVHLHRGDPAKRLKQSRELRDWASQEPLPIVVSGDCNFDFELPSGPGNPAFDEFGLGGTFEWEQPATLVATQYSDSNADGANDHDSVLDFFWSAGPAQSWAIQAEILVRPGDFPDDNSTSDHRPVLATIDTTAVTSLSAPARRRTLRVAEARTVADVKRAAQTPDAAKLSERTFGAMDDLSAGAPVAAMGAARDFGHFEGRVAATFDGDGRTMTLLEDFHYVDAQRRQWTAPRGSTIDGASIPRAFWSVIGGPFEGTYRNASVVHDVYCDSKDRPWRDVHRMFYEACRCGGASVAKSKVMYYAVYHFGPRWGAEPMAMSADAPLTQPEVEALSVYVNLQDPTLDELEAIPPSALDQSE